MGDVAGVPDPIDITTVQPGQAVSVDRTVAMQWDGGDAVVVTGEVKSVHGTNPPVRYIEVHPVGARKGLKRKVREDPRLMEASERSSRDTQQRESGTRNTWPALLCTKSWPALPVKDERTVSTLVYVRTRGLGRPTWLM